MTAVSGAPRLALNGSGIASLSVTSAGNTIQIFDGLPTDPIPAEGDSAIVTTTVVGNQDIRSIQIDTTKVNGSGMYYVTPPGGDEVFLWRHKNFSGVVQMPLTWFTGNPAGTWALRFERTSFAGTYLQADAVAITFNKQFSIFGSPRLAMRATGAAFQDWTISGVDLNSALFLLRLGDITLPISSWQATGRGGEAASFIQAVVPGYDAVADQIAARQGERMEILIGYRTDSGSVRYGPVISGPFTQLTAQFGPTNTTATLSGYGSLNLQPGEASRELRDVQTLSDNNGLLRVRCAIDLFLRPGMTAVARGTPFRVDYINYYGTAAGAFMEVGQSG